MKNKKNIKSLLEKDIENFLIKHNYKPFRKNQIFDWLWHKNASSFDGMTTLSKNLRDLLKANFSLPSISINKTIKSIDGTIKYSMKLYDDKLIEGVLIPSKNRFTACISSQVGCSLSCRFCATGLLNLQRNLTYSEIFEQVYILNQESNKHYEKNITNIVFMGMGEPLLNYANIIRGINLIISKKGLGISPKRITVSTVGIAKMIRKLADEKVKFNLAISLHSAIQDKRSSLMPISKSISLDELKSAVDYFYQETQIRPTYEYILLNNINDNKEDAQALYLLAKSSVCKINIIEYNKISGIQFKKSSIEKTNQFISFLESKNIIVTLRKSRGEDIDAACGQLINNLI